MRRLLFKLPMQLGFVLLWACQSSLLLAKPDSIKRSPEETMPASIALAFKQANVPLSAVSIMVTPLVTSPQAPLKQTPPRLQFRATEEMNPASVMKLITTSAGLSLLGPDFTWRNRIYIEGLLKDGVLQGNLYLKGSGDPKLVVERLQSLIQEVMAKGLREIKGDIILDGSVFDLPNQILLALTMSRCGPTTLRPRVFCSTSMRCCSSSPPMPPAKKPKLKASRRLPMFNGPIACPCQRVLAKIGEPNCVPTFPKLTACASMAPTPKRVVNKNGLWLMSNRKLLRRAWSKPCGAKRGANSRDKCATA